MMQNLVAGRAEAIEQFYAPSLFVEAEWAAGVYSNGGTKQIALSENQVVNVHERYVQYTTDTLRGSSGSPVFDDQWRVVAVHHAGGNIVMKPRGEKTFINEGILAEHVCRALGISLV
ncbi:Hypothetical protein A7982_08740 [Minicystis rosea]|nr:Hypothetical protein A7982_08740 [Minicystis rosea]